MRYRKLRELVRKYPKYKGCMEIERSPLITPGFPGTFNLSFTEGPWLEEYKEFIDFNHDYVFSTIQSCIRPNDFLLFNWKYLGVFEMSDVKGSVNLSKNFNLREEYQKQIIALVRLLNDLGIKPERIYPSYNSGGTVKDLTNGKFTLSASPAGNITASVQGYKPSTTYYNKIADLVEILATNYGKSSTQFTSSDIDSTFCSKLNNNNYILNFVNQKLCYL